LHLCWQWFLQLAHIGELSETGSNHYFLKIILPVCHFKIKPLEAAVSGSETRASSDNHDSGALRIKT
jgi:hypothetical protein